MHRSNSFLFIVGIRLHIGQTGHTNHYQNMHGCWVLTTGY